MSKRDRALLIYKRYKMKHTRENIHMIMILILTQMIAVTIIFMILIIPFTRIEYSRKSWNFFPQISLRSEEETESWCIQFWQHEDLYIYFLLFPLSPTVYSYFCWYCCTIWELLMLLNNRCIHHNDADFFPTSIYIFFLLHSKSFDILYFFIYDMYITLNTNDLMREMCRCCAVPEYSDEYFGYGFPWSLERNLFTNSELRKSITNMGNFI